MGRLQLKILVLLAAVLNFVVYCVYACLYAVNDNTDLNKV